MESSLQKLATHLDIIMIMAGPFAIVVFGVNLLMHHDLIYLDSGTLDVVLPLDFETIQGDQLFLQVIFVRLKYLLNRRFFRDVAAWDGCHDQSVRVASFICLLSVAM